MELRQLRIFSILANELNFTRAAERAHCVQSNVTVQIRSMEHELGVRLFERLGKQVRLTEHGQRLLPYAKRILLLLEEAGRVIADESNPSGTLIVGSPESVLTYRLPPVLHLFRESFPQVDLVLRATNSRGLVSQLEQGTLDLGIVIDDKLDDPRLQVERLCQEPLTLLAHPSHRLLRQPAVGPYDLREEAFLLTDAGCAYRSRLEEVLAKEDVTPRAVVEFTSVETIKQCAILGMGIACLPSMIAISEIAAGKLAALPWSGSDLTMQSQVVWHKDKWLSPAIKAFLSLLKKQFQGQSGA
jgi:DNA-binding transcriptional LysR family regulator